MDQDCGYYFQSKVFQKYNRFLLCGDNQIFLYQLNNIQVETFTSELSYLCGIGYENNYPPCWSLDSLYDPLLFINFVGVYNLNTNILTSLPSFEFNSQKEPMRYLEFKDNLIILNTYGNTIILTFLFKANNTISKK